LEYADQYCDVGDEREAARDGVMLRDWRQPKYTGPERRKKKRWRPRPFRVLLVLLVIAALGYGAAALWLMGQETRLVFEAGATLGPARPAIPYEEIALSRADGARQFAWLMSQPAADAPWVLYLHGNASTIASRVNIAHCEQLHRLGLNVLVPEYRGFAGLEGTPTEAALASDARAAYDYLRSTRRVSPGRLVVYGWSLGGAVAVTLAAAVDQAAVVLEAAPASMAALLQDRYPLFPMRLLVRNTFEAHRTIDRVGSPILILHGTADRVVPIEEGRRLFEAASEPKAFVELRGGHTDAIEIDADRLAGTVRAFLERHGIF
jgi:uncharacterized protein